MTTRGQMTGLEAYRDDADNEYRVPGSNGWWRNHDDVISVDLDTGEVVTTKTVLDVMKQKGEK